MSDRKTLMNQYLRYGGESNLAELKRVLPPDTLIKLVAHRGDVGLLRYLLQSLTADQVYNVLMTQRGAGDTDTAVHLAAVHGYTEAIKVMVDRLGPHQLQNLLQVKTGCCGKTALDYALENDHPDTAECIRQYLSKGDG